MSKAADKQDDGFDSRWPWRGKIGEAVGQQSARDDARLGVRDDRRFLVRRVHHDVDLTPHGSFQRLHGIGVGLPPDAAETEFPGLQTHPAEVQIGTVVQAG